MAAKRKKTQTTKKEKYQEEMPTRAANMTAAQRYDSLQGHRWPYWQRARQAAMLTIPGLMPPIGTTEATELDTPYQSVGARAVNNLAAKLLMSLFPVGTSFFRTTLDDIQKEKLAAKLPPDPNGLDARTAFERALQKRDNAISNRIEQSGSRTTFYDAFRQMIVSGNVLLHEHSKGKFEYFRLTHYVVQRNPQGEPIDIVLRQNLSRASLPKVIEEMIANNPTADAGEYGEYSEQTDKSSDPTISVFTRCRWKEDDNKWYICQEVDGKTIPGTESYEPKDACSFIPLALNLLDGENYGRGMVEEYFGDMRTMESGSQSVLDFGAAVARLLVFVDEGGVTDKSKVAKAPNGAVLDGKASDLSAFQLEKQADFQVLQAILEKAEKRLEQSFLLFEGAQRDAERVTAEEIRLVANELESSLGGLYSLLAMKMQLPIVNRVIHVMQAENAIPALPKDAVNLKIVTGLAALGRDSDYQRLKQMLGDLCTMFTGQVVAEYVSLGDIIARLCTALNIDADKMIKSDADVQQQRAAQNQQELVGKLGPSAIGAMSDQLKNAQQNGGGAPQQSTQR